MWRGEMLGNVVGFCVCIVTRSTVHIQSSSEFHLHFSSFWCWTNNIKTSLLISVRCLHPSKIIVVCVSFASSFSANKNDEITIIKLISLISKQKSLSSLFRILNLWDKFFFLFLFLCCCFCVLWVKCEMRKFFIQIKFSKDEMIYVIYIHIMLSGGKEGVKKSFKVKKLNEFEIRDSRWMRKKSMISINDFENCFSFEKSTSIFYFTLVKFSSNEKIEKNILKNLFLCKKKFLSAVFNFSIHGTWMEKFENKSFHIFFHSFPHFPLRLSFLCAFHTDFFCCSDSRRLIRKHEDWKLSEAWMKKIMKKMKEY